MPARFEDTFDPRWIDGHNWRIPAEFHYDTDVVLDGVPLGNMIGGPDASKASDIAGNRRITIPGEFITDFASIPRPLWGILSPVDAYSAAATIHDFLYRTPGLATRKQADDVLLEAMHVLKVSWWKRWAIYSGVRVFGGIHSYKGAL